MLGLIGWMLITFGVAGSLPPIPRDTGADEDYAAGLVATSAGLLAVGLAAGASQMEECHHRRRVRDAE